MGNYLVDLVRLGVPCEHIYSVPAGCLIRIDLERQTLVCSRYFTPDLREGPSVKTLNELAAWIRHRLDLWFGRLADHFSSHRVLVCLSGGLDSGLTAAFAQRYFRNVTAYTYSYASETGELSEDAVAARRLAEALAMPFHLVPASAEDVLSAVWNALVNGQDWRDFNVQCAIVNELLARAMEQDLAHVTTETGTLVLTGDLMNEFLADYTPVVYRGKPHYVLPQTDREFLRRVLIRGLDAGDREIGVFARHGLDVIQPYGLLADALLRLPSAVIRDPDAKPNLARAVAGDLLPEWIFHRPKVRAQIGGARCVTGILPTLVQHGRDATWLKRAFGDIFDIEDATFFNRFIRAGVYRPLREFPRRIGKSDYLAC